MGMSKRVKALIENAYGHSVWIGRATQRQKVLDLIARLRPLVSDRGLARIGPPDDGGYLMPDDLEGVTLAISPGVSTESRFDLALAERGIDVHMLDASVEGPSIQHPRFHFSKLFLGPVSGGQFVTMADFCERVPGFEAGGDLVLQMDIEGAEYPVIAGMTPELLSRFRIIVLEVHGLENLFHEFAFDVMAGVFDKLLASHAVVHLHPNNCCGMAVSQGIEVPRVLEMTLYRRDRARFTPMTDGAYPHALDADNVPGKEPLILPLCWR